MPPFEQLRSPEKTLVDNFEISRLNPELTQQFREQMRTLHMREWQREGMCFDPAAPESQVDLFNLEESFVIFDPETHRLLAQINSVPTDAASLRELCALFPTYRSIVDVSRNHDVPQSDSRYRICFSVTASQDHRLKIMGKPVSPAGTMLRSMDGLTPEIKIAYSRLGGVPQGTEDLVEFYVEQLRLSQLSNRAAQVKARQALGAVGMHEHLGGIVVAILQNSRPEDQRAGGANVLVRYPQTPEEISFIKDLRKQRLTGSIPTEEIDSGILLTDALALDR